MSAFSLDPPCIMGHPSIGLTNNLISTLTSFAGRHASCTDLGNSQKHRQHHQALVEAAYSRDL